MKPKRLITFAFTFAVLSAPASAQSGKVAIVDTRAFAHPQKGITRLIKTIESLERDHEQERAELVEMYERIDKESRKLAFSGPIPTDPQPMTPERRKRLKAKIEALRRSFARQEAETQRGYSRRYEEATALVLQDIRRKLESFAKSRGITVLLDAGKAPCLVGCDEKSFAAIDITREFIAEYNRLHP